MPTKKRTISVRLDEVAKRRVERAAKLMKQSAGAFLERAGEAQAYHVLIAWAIDQHRRGEASFSELAAQTGLAVEEIMLAMGSQGRDEALDMFLASCRTVAEERNNPEFLRLGQEAVRIVGRTEQENINLRVADLSFEAVYGSVKPVKSPADIDEQIRIAKEGRALRKYGHESK